MAFRGLVFVVVAIAASVGTNAAKLPSTFSRCSKSDPNFDQCITINIENAIRNLKDGAPELTLAPFEPLEIESLVIGQGTGPVNVQQNFHNVHIHGLTSSKVLNSKNSIGDKEISLFSQSITPELRMEADYDMKGRVLLLPIFGKGPCNVTLMNTRINHTMIGETFMRKGREFVKFHTYTVTLRPELVKFQFANLFNGDERLGHELNKVLNENWEAVFSDVRGGYEKSFGVIFQDLTNRVFTRVPLKDIFLE